MRNIVILGAGFGGIRAAKILARKLKSQKDWHIVLVDKNPFHIYYPKLFEEVLPNKRDRHAPTVVGTRDDENGKCTVSLHEILKGTGVEFLQGTVNGIDFKKKQIVISTGAKRSGEISRRDDMESVRSLDSARDDENFRFSYDYLILALGADADYFGISGLKENAIVLRSLQDAKRIRNRVEEFFKVHNPPQPSLNLREGDQLEPPLRVRGGRGSYEAPFSIVIGGAGATGVELAASLAHQFRGIEKSKWSVTIVEALPRVLSMFPNDLSQYAHRRLEKLGVHLMLDTCIKSVEQISSSRPKCSEVERSHTVQDVRSLDSDRDDNAGVEVVLAPRPLKSGEIDSELLCDFLPDREKRVHADLLIWTGGVRANPLLAKSGIPTDKKGRVEVDEHMTVKGVEHIFAIGDNAFLTDPERSQPVPGTAQAALKEAEIAAYNVFASIRGKTLALYEFPKFSAIVPLAGRDCVALFGNRIVKGLPAWLLRHAADCRYFASIIGWYRAIKKCILA